MPSPPLVDLDRRFVQVSAADAAARQVESLSRAHYRSIDWTALLDVSRAVVLAEAGSGKTAELRSRTNSLRKQGQFAFYATVGDVGREGFVAALDGSDKSLFEAWVASEERAWLFVDSVDEAKLDGIVLRKAMRQVASAVRGRERRANVILSGRYTDWDYEADLETVSEILPGRNREVPLPADELDLVGLILDSVKPSPPPSEPPVEVYLMTELDEPRVRRFAEQSSVPDLPRFISEIDASNLWRFARRPLDLSWMVEFWRSHRRLGSLSEMMDASLTARSRELNSVHDRIETLSPDRCRKALERIGAAVVFCRKQNIALKTSDLGLNRTPNALDLEAVLPDWTSSDIARLLRRAVFDPATFGRSRLHNDNRGEVSSFLAAQWLKRLLAANRTLTEVREVLLAEIYGNRLVRRSTSSTAAWLVLDSPDILRDLIDRDPGLLFVEGDPGSLTPSQRSRALSALARCLEGNPRRWFHFPRDNLKRFATSEIAETVRLEWVKHAMSSTVLELLLLLIRHGKLRACLDLAEMAASDARLSDTARMLAGQIIIETGDRSALSRFAERVRQGFKAMSPPVAWSAVLALFPEFLTIQDFFQVFDSLRTEVPASRGYGLEDLVEKIHDANDLENFVVGLFSRVGAGVPHSLHQPYFTEISVQSAISSGSTKLLTKCAPDVFPISVAKIFLERKRQERHGSIELGEDEPFASELCRTPERRRAMFWFARQYLTDDPVPGGNRLNHPSQMEYLGWPNNLVVGDIGWLMTDLRARADEDERLLCLLTAYGLCQYIDDGSTLIDSLRSAIKGDQLLERCLEHWISPPETGEQILNQVDRVKADQARHREEKAARNRSWSNFLAEMKSSTEVIAKLPSPVGETADSRLFNLWKLARSVGGSNTRYTIADIPAVEHFLGSPLFRAFGNALSTFWRGRHPTLRSSRPAGERNQVFPLDCMALAGISFEAAANRGWAQTLSPDEASAATRFGTLELNAFPPFMVDLAEAHPQVVAEILGDEIVKEIDDEERGVEGSPFLLDRLVRAQGSIVKALRPRLLTELARRTNPSPAVLEAILDSIFQQKDWVQPPVANASNLIRLASQATNLKSEALYVAKAFFLEPVLAINHVESRRSSMDNDERSRYLTAVLPEMLRTNEMRVSECPNAIPVGLVERLTVMAFDDIRLEDDRATADGKVRNTDERDVVERARDGLLNVLAGSPGRPSYEALVRLSQMGAFAVCRDYLLNLAARRAEADADGQPWTIDDVKRFEDTGERRPHTAAELQHLLMRRFEDFQHSLLHDDFSQGVVLKVLPNEEAVQKWVANILRLHQRDSYGVEREPHRADEKEPDIVARAKSTDASVPVEIKVAESWTLQELLDALRLQLCGRYLRASNGKHGILLLVHQAARPIGWKVAGSSKNLRFDEMVELLKAEAASLASGDSDAPQPLIAVLDVSSVVGPDVKPSPRARSTRRTA